jgi:hypothetical protein
VDNSWVSGNGNTKYWLGSDPRPARPCSNYGVLQAKLNAWRAIDPARSEGIAQSV